MSDMVWGLHDNGGGGGDGGE